MAFKKPAPELTAGKQVTACPNCGEVPKFWRQPVPKLHVAFHHDCGVVTFMPAPVLPSKVDEVLAEWNELAENF